MKTTKEIAQTLAKRREHLKLTQKDIKGLIGMSQQQYSKAESTGEISLKTLLRILEALDLEIEFIPKEHLQKEAVLSNIKKTASLTELIAFNKKLMQTTSKMQKLYGNNYTGLKDTFDRINRLTKPHSALSEKLNRINSLVNKYPSKLESLKDDD